MKALMEYDFIVAITAIKHPFVC